LERRRAGDLDRQLSDSELCRGEDSRSFYEHLDSDVLRSEVDESCVGGLSEDLYSCRKFASVHGHFDPRFSVVTVFDRSCLVDANPGLQPVRYDSDWLRQRSFLIFV